MINSQNQKAGDNSQQFQASHMVVNVGIDEKRAREIYQEMNLQLRKDYSNEAFELATARVSEFESKLMSKMDEVEGALNIFADPSFQLLLVEAQKTAAATERPADYELLSELLIHRFKVGENRITRAGINRAVEIVDEISDDALLGITTVYAITALIPRTNNVLEGLDLLEETFGKIFYSDLPVGDEWIDHLDILNSIRINNLVERRKIIDIYAIVLSKFFDVGIEKNSTNFNEAQKILQENGIVKEVLKEHELNSEFVKLVIPREEIKDAAMIKTTGTNSENIPFSEEQKNALEQIYQLYNHDSQEKEKNSSMIIAELDRRKNLKRLKEWWDSSNLSFTITSVGKVLAHSNLERCDKNVPNFR